MNDKARAAPAGAKSPTVGRHGARRLTIQALYQWEMTGDGLGDILKQCRERESGRMAIDYDYVDTLVRGVAGDVNTLDMKIEQYLDRPMLQLDPIERNILRAAAYEFCARVDVPYRVVINEAVELAKVFGSEEGHKYVNGVLDKLARQVRMAETRPKQN